MNRALIPIAGLLLLVSCLPSSAATRVVREVNFSPADVSVKAAAAGDRVRLEGGYSRALPGQPDLPWSTLSVEVPAGSRLVSCKVVPLEWTDLARTAALRPSPAWTGSEGHDFQPAPEFPDSEGWFPCSPGGPASLGRFQGHAVAQVALRPLRYQSSSGRLRLLKRVSVELVLQDGAELPLARVRRTPLTEEAAGQALGKLGIPSARAPNALPGRGGAFPLSPGESPSPLGHEAAYIIVTADSLAGAFQPLADWKIRQGISCRIVSLSTILSAYPQGVDTPEKIRLYARDAYQYQGAVWLLLGGGAAIIPPRFVYCTLNRGDFIPADSYYGNLDGNWDANGNSIFGQPDDTPGQPGDAVDFYPELYVGRAPCGNSAEVATFVNKTLMYDKTPPANFLDNALFFSEVLFPSDYVLGQVIQLDGAVLSESVLGLMYDTNHVARLYENNDPDVNAGSLPESRTAVVDSLNAGYNLALHVGHGFRNTMSVGTESLVNGDLRGLHNGARSSFLVSMDCTSGAFDFDCIGAASVTNPSGGAFAFWGSTREGFPAVAFNYLNDFFSRVVGDSAGELGAALAMCKLPSVPFSQSDYPDRWSNFAQVLFGDPGLRYRMRSASSFAVAYPLTYATGTAAFAVTVTGAGAPVESALVCVRKSGDDLRAGYTNAAGLVTLPFQPDSAGSFQLTVTRGNFLPFLAGGSVVARSGPYLYDLGSSKTILDGTVAPQSGNGDGVVDAGETIQLGVVLGNNGGVNATGVVGTLSCDSAGVTIGTPTVNYGSIGSHASSIGGSRYKVTFSRSLRDGRTVPFNLHLTDAQGDVRDDFFRLPVRAPVPEQYAHVWFDSIAGPNHITVLKVAIRNLGSGPFRSLVGKARPAFAGLVALDTTSSYGSLAPGASWTGSAEYRFRGQCVAQSRFWLFLTDAYGHVDTLGFSLSAPRPVTGLSAVGSQNSLSLTWLSSPDSGVVAGYYIYRGLLQAGPFSRANSRITGRINYYRDSGLLPLTNYYYYVTAVDSAGNEGAPSVAATASTNPPYHTGWPITTGTEMAGSPALVNIDHSPDGSLELVQASDGIYMWHPDGSEVRDGDQQPVTSGLWLKRGDTYPNSVAISQLFENGKYYVAAVSRDSDYVFVWDELGDPAPGWPQRVSGFPFGTIAIGDVDGDGHPEVVLGCGPFLYAWHRDGTEVRDGDSNPATNGVFAVPGGSYCYASPSIADVDHDGIPDIVLGTGGGLMHAYRWNGTEVKGFPFAPGGAITGSPAVADLDLDGHTEIIFPCTNSKLYCLTDTGTVRAGWPLSMALSGTSRSPSPAIADLDGDGYPDVVEATTDGYMRVVNRDGVALPGWGSVRFAAAYAALAGATESSPIVADLNGDGGLEVIQGAEDATLYAFRADGTPEPGFPIRVGGEIRGTPAVWDVTNTGHTNIVLSCWDKKIYMWDYPGTFNRLGMPWPMFRHDDQRGGQYNVRNVITAVGGAQLRADAVAEGIRISWSAPEAPDGRVSWNLYRREDPLEKPAGAAPRELAEIPTDFVKINAAPIPEGPRGPGYVDQDVRGGRTFVYILETLVEGRRVSLSGPLARSMPARFLPVRAALFQNAPNPFAGHTEIAFMVPVQSGGGAASAAGARLTLHDVSGRQLRVLSESPLAPGRHSVRWDGRDQFGRALPAGIYFYRLQAGGEALTRKLLLAR